MNREHAVGRTWPALALWCLLSSCSEDATTGEPEAWPIDGQTGLRVPELGPVPSLPDWEDNPATPAKAELGQLLFNDVRLSKSGRINCGTCHLPITDFQSNAPKDTPARSTPALEPVLPRNAPSLLNVVYREAFHWDGSGGSLYEAMVLPFAAPDMDLTNLASGDNWSLDIPEAQRQLFERLTDDATDYPARFQAVFDVDIVAADATEVWELTGKALATYLRVAVSRDAAFDDWNAGGPTELDEEALAGLELFVGKGQCVGCHSGPMFSDSKYHNLSIGAPWDGEDSDEGRFRVTGLPEDRGAFLTPSLRGAVRSSPFWHDGSEIVLAEVIAYHASEQARSDPGHAPLLDDIEPLSPDEVASLVAFLKTLEGALLRFD